MTDSMAPHTLMRLAFTATVPRVDADTPAHVFEQARRHVGPGLEVTDVFTSHWSPSVEAGSGEILRWETRVEATAALAVTS